MSKMSKQLYNGLTYSIHKKYIKNGILLQEKIYLSFQGRFDLYKEYFIMDNQLEAEAEAKYISRAPDYSLSFLPYTNQYGYIKSSAVRITSSVLLSPWSLR